MKRKKIALIPGDGIGPEISMDTVGLVSAVAADLEWVELSHEDAYVQEGRDFWDKLSECDAILKGPTTTPQGSGRRSLNVAMRTSLGLYANVRPIRSLDPLIPCSHPMDMIIVRENEEDLYTGMEYRQSRGQSHALKISSSYAATRLAVYALELARKQSREKVTCMTKDNILKITDGSFARAFKSASMGYPEVVTNHKIIDIGTALVATHPSEFEVIVTTNLYGDIVSDVAAQVAGSVGLMGSANIGDSIAMFEAIHGSAPDIAGRDLANPSGLISSSVMMLSYLGYDREANLLEDAWLATLEDGVITKDLADHRRHYVGTAEFAGQVARRIGSRPRILKRSRPFPRLALPVFQAPVQEEGRVIGADIFISQGDREQAKKEALVIAKNCAGTSLEVSVVSNRGTSVSPDLESKAWMSDQWRYRLMTRASANLDPRELWTLLARLSEESLEVIRVETLNSSQSGPQFSE